MVGVLLSLAFVWAVPAWAAAGTGVVAVTSAQQAPRLTAFTNGIGNGMHAVYVHANYDALLRPDGYLFVYPKEKGQRVGNPLTMGLETMYIGNVRAIGRPIATFDNDKGPLMNPARIELTGKLEDDIPYGVSFTFEKNSISIRGYCKDPPQSKTPTSVNLVVGIPPSHTFTAETPQAEREAKLKGMAVVTRTGQKKSVYPYANGAVMAGAAEKCWIDGPVYGSRKISFDAGSPDTAPMRPWIYEHVAPYNGFVVRMFKQDPSSKKLGERLTVTIQ
jgi:hypothetical protein